MNDIAILWFMGSIKICSDKDLEISCQNKNFSDRKFYPRARATLFHDKGG